MLLRVENLETRWECSPSPTKVREGPPPSASPQKLLESYWKACRSNLCRGEADWRHLRARWRGKHPGEHNGRHGEHISLLQTVSTPSKLKHTGAENKFLPYW